MIVAADSVVETLRQRKNRLLRRKIAEELKPKEDEEKNYIKVNPREKTEVAFDSLLNKAVKDKKMMRMLLDEATQRGFIDLPINQAESPFSHKKKFRSLSTIESERNDLKPYNKYRFEKETLD